VETPRLIRLLLGIALVFVTSIAASARQQPVPNGVAGPLQAGRSAEDVYRDGCVTCHGPDGKGSPRAVVGFEVPLPDFTDCAFASGEPDPDWFAVIHEGGPVRGLDRHMPAFGDALAPDDITLAIAHIRTFCRERAWPQGDLNLPRAFFTEKAFPENEAVWTMAMTGGHERSIENELVYEQRLGPRNQVEVVAPIVAQESATGEWRRGLGDVALAFKRTLYASMRRGQIGAAGIEVILPTGNESHGLGNGYTVFEPFAMWGQILPRNSFLQLHAGVELPSDGRKGAQEAFIRSSVGTTLASDRGFGRAWSPQFEVLWARPERSPSEWDVVPQIQVTLSKLQHVMLAAAVRVPITQRDERRTQALVYLLWDWFDGGLFEMWR
jgi:mono/diheme cytochrome c family protein